MTAEVKSNHWAESLAGREIVWAPQSGGSELFLQCPTDEALLDGNRGGGKTDTLLMDFAQHVDQGYGEHWRGILFRKTFAQLEEIVSKIERYWPRMWPGTKFNHSEYSYSFPNGEKFFLRYFRKVSDYWNYHGHEYCVGVGTRVRMADGTLLPIERIRVGDFVATLEGPRAVIQVFPQQWKPAVRIYVYAADGRLVGWQDQSVDHRWLTNVATSSTRLADLCGSGWRTPTHQHFGEPIWLRPGFRPGTLAVGALSSDDQTADTWFAAKSLDVQRLQQLGSVPIPAVLALPSRGYPGAISTECRSLCRSSELSWETDRRTSGSHSGPQRPFALQRSRADHGAWNSADGERHVPLDYRRLLDSQGRCGNDHDPYGERVPREARAFRDDVPSPSDAASPSRGAMRADDRDSTPECIRPDDAGYIHPYTKERRPLTIRTESGFCLVQSCGPRLTVDIGVAGSGHYITESGLVNKNCWIGWEELTSWPDLNGYMMMMACNRSAAPVVVGERPMPRKLRATTNPYGVGHNIVKSRFVDPGPAGTVTTEEIETVDPRTGLLTKFSLRRTRVRLFLSENKKLLAVDPTYIAKLVQQANGDQVKLKAWLEGDWDITAGGMFDDLWDRRLHTIPRFRIPASWYVDRSFDWGSSRPFSVGWWAESDGTTAPNGVTYPKGTLFRINEWYGWNGRPNEGLKMRNSDIAKGIREREDAMIREGWAVMVRPGPADSSIFDVDNEEKSIAKDMLKGGVRWLPANKSPGSRKNGWDLVRERLGASTDRPMEEPGFFVFDTCIHFIRLFPSLPRDEKNPDDVDTEAEDHIGDETRYRVLHQRKTGKVVQVVGV